MMSETMKMCADLILTAAIEDTMIEEQINLHEARTRLIESEAYKALYDEKTELWQEGPDYFRDYLKQLTINDTPKY